MAVYCRHTHTHAHAHIVFRLKWPYIATVLAAPTMLLFSILAVRGFDSLSFKQTCWVGSRRVADAAHKSAWWASPGSTWMQGSDVSIGAAGDALTATALAIVPRSLARRLCSASSSPKSRPIVPRLPQVSFRCQAPQLLSLSAQARLLT